MAKILVVTAHPDDETFGPGATIAKYAARGVEVHVLCASRGEAGQWSEVVANGRTLGEVREAEHRSAVKILGAKKLSYLDYIDGTISNTVMEELIARVKAKADDFKPDVMLTFDLGGISGHLDHVAMNVAATKAFYQVREVKKLYYFAVEKTFTDKMREKTGRVAFGRNPEEITTIIDVKDFLETKIKAAQEHQTQKLDFDRLIPFWRASDPVDRFILAASRVKSTPLETDLLAGI